MSTLRFRDQALVAPLLTEAFRATALPANGWELLAVRMTTGTRWQIEVRLPQGRGDLLLFVDPLEPGRPAFRTTRLFAVSYLEPDFHLGHPDYELLTGLAEALRHLEQEFDGLDLAAVQTPRANRVPAEFQQLEMRADSPLSLPLLDSDGSPERPAFTWPHLFEGWTGTKVEAFGSNKFGVTLERDDGAASFTLFFSPWDEQTDCFYRVPFANVGYACTTKVLSLQYQAATAKSLIEQFVQRSVGFFSLYPHLAWSEQRLAHHREQLLALTPGDSAAAARQLMLSVEGLYEFLQPELQLGEPFFGSWVLSEIVYGNTAHAYNPVETYHVLFRHEVSGELLSIRISRREELRSFYAVSNHLGIDINFFRRLHAAAEPPSLEALSLFSHFMVLLQLKDTPGLVVLEDPRKAGRLLENSRKQPSGDSRLKMYNLAIDSPCQQDCSFCILPETRQARDTGREMLHEILRQLGNIKGEGFRALRLNGIDPLSFSHLWEVMEAIQGLDLEFVDVFSPGRRLADPAFTQRFLSYLPDKFMVNFPLYGASAEVHEAVTRLPGSFRQVMQAIETVLRLAGPTHLTLLTVVTRQNVQGLPDLAAWARERELSLALQMPFPMEGSHSGRYREAAVRESEIVAALARQGESQGEFFLDLHPCVAFWHMQRTGQPSFAWWSYDYQATLGGVVYTEKADRIQAGVDGAETQAAFAFPCPHQARCVLSNYCPKGFYALYVDLFGVEEFQPVTLQDLAGAKLPAEPPVWREGPVARHRELLRGIKVQE